MERLTCLKTPARWDSGRHPTKYTSRSTFPEVVERLAYYEDADQDGRLVVLPCKLHKSIFYIEDGNWFEDVPYEANIGERSGESVDVVMFLCEDGFSFYEDDIGKTVFFTPDEAEAALKGGAE